MAKMAKPMLLPMPFAASMEANTPNVQISVTAAELVVENIDRDDYEFSKKWGVRSLDRLRNDGEI
jgi:hypothetical protein